MKVKDMMSKGVVTVDESLSIREVAGVMARYDISGVAVVGKEGSLEGTISSGDIVEAIAEEKNIEKLRAGDIMIPCTITIDPDATIRDAAKIIKENRIHRLFVFTGGRGVTKIDKLPEGIVSVSDIIKELALSK